jgi:hypothetical protein
MNIHSTVPQTVYNDGSRYRKCRWGKEGLPRTSLTARNISRTDIFN